MENCSLANENRKYHNWYGAYVYTIQLYKHIYIIITYDIKLTFFGLHCPKHILYIYICWNDVNLWEYHKNNENENDDEIETQERREKTK